MDKATEQAETEKRGQEKDMKGGRHGERMWEGKVGIKTGGREWRAKSE